MITARALIIDCDTGRDDALSLLLAQNVAMPLVGVVTSYGNVALPKVIENTARVLALSGSTVPLYAGTATPLAQHPLWEEIVLPRHAAAGNGLCNLELPAAPHALPPSVKPAELAQKIYNLATLHGLIDYVILGPATNFALLCQELGSDITKCLASVTMMGGRLNDLWAATPEPDFNIACDPFAVARLLQSPIPKKFVPLNATWPIMLTLTEIEALSPTTPTGIFAQKLMATHCRDFTKGEHIFRLHDPIALLAAQQNANFISTHLTIQTDTNHPDFGRMEVSTNGYAAEIYTPDSVTAAALKQTIINTVLQ